MEPKTDNSKVALVRAPATTLASGLTTVIERHPVDVSAAVEQWQGYLQAMQASGWTLQHVATDDRCPDSVFIEDAAVVHDGLAVIANPGADERKPEVAPVAAALGDLGYDLHGVTAPGTLDGGDVLKVGSTIYVGVGHRTNAAGVDQARQAFARAGAKVIAVPNRGALHLKSAVTALPDGTIIGWPPAIDDVAIFPDMLAMPEEAGAHVVDLGDGQLLMSASAPRSIELLQLRGWTPVPVKIDEFEKLEGCVTCLSIRLRALPGHG